MRYFFNLASQYEYIPDEIGMEARDFQTAIAGARRAIEELRDETPAWIDGSEWRLEIADEDGRILETILLDQQ